MNKTISISEAISNGWKIFISNWKFWLVVSLLLGGAKSLGGVGSSFSSMANPAIFNQEMENTSEAEYQNQFNDFSEFEETSEFSGFRDKVLGSKTNLQYEGESDTENSPIAIVAFIIVFIITALIIGIMLLTNLIFKMGYIKLKIDAARRSELDYKTLLSQVSYKKALKLATASFFAIILILVGFLLLILPGFIFMYKFIFIPYVIVEEDAKIFESFKRSSQITKGVRFKLFLYGLVMFILFILGMITIVGWIFVAIISQFALAYIYVKLKEQEDAPHLVAETTPTPPVPEPKAVDSNPAPPLQEAPKQQNTNTVQ